MQFCPSYILLRLLLCPWRWGIFFWWGPTFSCQWLFSSELQFWNSCRRRWAHVLQLWYQSGRQYIFVVPSHPVPGTLRWTQPSPFSVPGYLLLQVPWESHGVEVSHCQERFLLIHTSVQGKVGPIKAPTVACLRVKNHKTWCWERQSHGSSFIYL